MSEQQLYEILTKELRKKGFSKFQAEAYASGIARRVPKTVREDNRLLTNELEDIRNAMFSVNWDLRKEFREQEL